MARIRSSARGQAAAAAKAAKDIDFKHLWRQLRAAGWTARRPSGLATEWSYVTPGSSGVEEGVDFFVGERSGLLVSDDEGDEEMAEEVEDSAGVEDAAEELVDAAEVVEQAAEEAVEEAVDAAEKEDEVRASQIDTSVALSQNTVTALFGSPTSSNDDEELSQAAVARAFDLKTFQQPLVDGRQWRRVGRRVWPLHGTKPVH
ncbi:hypothetical protein P43SY_007749 [Pythium insidiosum]|uniref:Uncharacterized protein n=1 Tax=Pythium insidiosum TaxID=114742 RepID=A0AAD5Q4Q7_PYTIN|nr:hypothetical protein P43SY_007749 [Pythium insidiosum]